LASIEENKNIANVNLVNFGAQIPAKDSSKHRLKAIDDITPVFSVTNFNNVSEPFNLFNLVLILY